MENKNNTLLIGIGGIVLGFIIGAICFGSFGMGGRGMMGNRYSGNDAHMMNDGHMMMDNKMDMDDMMGSMMSGLEGKTGDTFDQAFISEMIVHHEGAVAMAEKVLQVSTRPELRTLAGNIISAQNAEIAQMKGWLAVWFK